MPEDDDPNGYRAEGRRDELQERARKRAEAEDPPPPSIRLNDPFWSANAFWVEQPDRRAELIEAFVNLVPVNPALAVLHAAEAARALGWDSTFADSLALALGAPWCHEAAEALRRGDGPSPEEIERCNALQVPARRRLAAVAASRWVNPAAEPDPAAELLHAAEAARETVAMVAREFNSSNFTDRYGDGPKATVRLAALDDAIRLARKSGIR